jgi:AraC family transcriptional regulator
MPGRAREAFDAPDHQPLALIALEAGFADQSHFTIAFRREMGVTPGRFRAALA